MVSAGLSRTPDSAPLKIAEWIVALASAFEEIDPSDVRAVVNEERVASGFPEISDQAIVEEAIDSRRQHYRTIMREALDRLPSDDLVRAVTFAVDTVTDNGAEHGLVLIDELVDAYEVDAQEFLDIEAGNIRNVIPDIRSAVEGGCSDAQLDSMIDDLIRIVKNWDRVAQPIQLSTKSRGLDHEASQNVAGLVRNFAVELFNEHGKLDIAKRLTDMLSDVFAEVVDVAEMTSEDSSTLSDISDERDKANAQSQKDAEEWARAVSYEGTIGTVFKKTLRISPQGIVWKDRTWALNSIVRIRWGAVRRTVNGIPSGTTYTVSFGTKDDYCSINPNEAVFNEFIDRLWKAVGVRLLTSFLEGLGAGKQYRFDSALIRDDGIELEKGNWFSANERMFFGWHDLVIWNGDGNFYIGKKDNKKFKVGLSYLEDDNVHVLEAAIRAFWKSGGNRISSLIKG